MAISLEIGTIEDALTVESGIPEFGGLRSEAQYMERFDGNPYLILIAWDRYEHGDRPVGYKVGYEVEKGIFYSWVGGVITGFRRLGLAQRLLEMQEAWAKEHGYEKLRVKSMNKFPFMVMLLIKNGYKIVDLEGPSGVEKPDPDATKILFQKMLV